MKNMNKLLLLAGVFFLGTQYTGAVSRTQQPNNLKLAIAEKAKVGGLPSNLISKDGNVDQSFGTDGVQNFGVAQPAEDVWYRTDFLNGTSKNYNSIVTALSEMTTGSTLVVLSNMNINRTSSLQVGKSGVTDITID